MTASEETMKPGTKLKSAVCDTEVMVIRGTGMTVECGGAPMVQEQPAERGSINAGFAQGTQIGKRYVDSGGALELLCVKAGKGSLSIGGIPLQLKGAKPLPASD
ncbi:MAG: hypothetical protein JO042_05915 [Sinobacteraceae bacterium]|nr:hypothetical protein [Nevskiaceae bacterium]